MRHRWAVLAAISIPALLPSPAFAQGGGPRVIVNETAVSFPTPPQVERGVLMAPLGPLASAFGATVARDGGSREVTVISSAGVAVQLAIGDTAALAGGARITLPVAPMHRAGTVWVPAGALLRALGAYVRIDDGAGVVDAVSQVTGITWRRGSDGLVLRIAATGPVKTRTYVLTDPDRLAVDIVHAVDSLPESKMKVDDRDVVAIRSGQFSVRPYVTRIVLDLIHPVPYTVAVHGEGVAVTVSQAVVSQDSPPSGPPAPPFPGRSASPDEVLGSGPRSEVAEHDPEHPAAAAPLEPRASPPLPEFVDGPGAFHVGGVTYELEGGTGRLTVAASQPMAPVVRQFAYPDRLAIDLPGGMFLPRRQDLEVGSDVVRNIVINQVEVHPNLTRIVVYLQRKATYTTASSDGGRALSLVLADVRPAAKRPPAVVIDPGHGGPDSGAIGPAGLQESDVALRIGRLLQQELERQGVRAVLTRTDDRPVRLEDRPDIARREGGIVFVSIHANATASSLRRGTETYYATPDSAALAAMIHSEVVRALGEPDRGIRVADFYVLVNTPMPAVLIETAFISNPGEERLLRDPAVQRRIADAIARAIVRFLAARTEAPAP